MFSIKKIICHVLNNNKNIEKIINWITDKYILKNKSKSFENFYKKQKNLPIIKEYL